MSEYFFKPSMMRRVFTLPNAVVDQHLRMAGSVQLKVLLWLSRTGGEFDAELCAKAVGVSAADCCDALQYWLAQGVLEGDVVVSPTAQTVPPIEQPEMVVVSTPTKKPTTQRVKVTKPPITEVIARQTRDEEFGGLLTEVSARMGRPLSGGDAETLLYLYDTVKLPAAVILMVVGYAAQADRFTMRYIEKVALDWADRGIMTMAAAEEHLCYLERCDQAALRVQAVCQLAKPISGAAAIRTAEKWIFQWQVTDELLAQAFDVCREKTGKFEAKYMDRVLENWREQGVDTPEKVAEMSAKPKKKNVKTDTAYEHMIEQYVPVYKKKKR